MGSKRKGGVCNLPSSSEEDEGSVWRKRPVLKMFRIYSTEYVTSSNRDEKKRAAVKVPLNVNTTEREIRDYLIRELPQLSDKRFTFFTKDEAGKWYFCPCSLQCEGKDHSAEWNGRNIPRAAKSNRTVYIFIKSTTVEETRSGGVQNDTPMNPVRSDLQLRGLLGHYSSNPLNQKEGRFPKNYQSVSCPELSLSGLDHQENTSVQPLSVNHGNDLNQWPIQLTQPSQQTVSETEYEKVRDGGGVTEEKYGEGEGRIDISDEEMQTDVWNNDVASTSENLESGYNTFPSENDTWLPVNPSDSVEDEELRNFFVNGSPLLNTNFNSNASLSTPTEFMENCQEHRRPQTTIEKIVPKKGDVAGGEPFYLSFGDACDDHDFQVQFGPSRIPVKRCSDKVFEGIVPSSSTDGVVKVYLVDYLRRTISNFVHFEYYDPRKAKEDCVEKEVKTPADLQKMFLLLCTKMGKMNLTSNDTKDSKGTNPPGGVKTQALSLFYMIASTAAKLNAMDFFRIIFSTQVGHKVFKSCKSAQTPLEEIARENGHEELARLLEQKHSMYQDYENESDDEVDWKELARAIEKHQTLKGETAERKSICSTSSSEQIQGYLGDGESSTSLSSLHLLDVDGCTESTFEYQQTTEESMSGEEPNTCQSTGCPESTFEEQQTTPESTCEEEPNTGQTIAAEGRPENTLKEQQTIPKSRCREKPDTCQTNARIARGLIQDGMSDTDIINTISSSDQLRINKAHQIKESQSLIGEKNLPVKLHLAGISPIIMRSFQMDKFAPKEVSSLRRKLAPFDAAKMNPSALYPDRDQTIYYLMERLDTPSELDFLEELKQDLTGDLKAQKGSKHQETAQTQLSDVKRKGATAMKTNSITSLNSPLHSKVESGVEIATIAGSASKIILEEQSTGEEISQDTRSFKEHFFKKQDFEASKNARKSLYLRFRRRRRWVLTFWLPWCLIFAALIVVSFTLWGVGAQTVPSCDAESITIKDPVSGSVQCQVCRKCPAGEGLSVSCGDEISSGTPIVCKPCVLGETYSSAYEAGACKDCEICGPYRETTKACTLTSKAECGKCKVGAYVEPMLSICKPCSQCCNDGKDIVISQCQVPSVPASKQCSFARSGMCSKVVTTVSVSTVSPTLETNHSTVHEQSTIPPTVRNPVVTSNTALSADASPSQINVVKYVFLGAIAVFFLHIAYVIRIQSVKYRKGVMVKRRKARKLVDDVSLAGTAHGERPEQVPDNNQQANASDGNETDHPTPASDYREETTVPVQENGDKSQDKTGTQETKPRGRHGNTDMLQKGLVKTNEVNHGILPSESRDPLLGKGNQEELSSSCQQESKLLSSLLDDQPYLQAISECLDLTLAAVGNYRAVAQNYGLNHYRISSVLEKNDRGPTTALIESLAATQPKLTVQAFTTVVRQKAKRKDVAYLLEAYDSGKKLGDV